jgi:probable F420-dependent oxidoreductase
MSLKFNLMFPMRAVKHWQDWSQGTSIGEIAALVEDAGFAGFSMSEHPYPDKRWLSTGGHHAFDPFVSLSFAAAATRTLRVITFIMVSGYRNPYLAAKAAASLDLLSGGRFVLGTAAGYLQSEFEALGADFGNRGELMDEAIQAWRSVWVGQDHSGPRFGVTGHLALPLPSTPGGPPIWIGGNGAAARRRVIEHADGWIPMAASGEMATITRARPLEDVKVLGDWIADVNTRRAERGRGPAEVAFMPFEAGRFADGAAAFCTAVRPRLAEYAEAGVNWITVEPASRNATDFRADVETLSSLIGQ